MFLKLHSLQKLLDCGVVAVLRKIPPEHMERVAESLLAGGVTALEVVLDHPQSCDSIRTLSRKFGGDALVGAGSVLDGDSAAAAIRHGAEFLVSPHVNREMIRTALRYGKIAIPGAFTPTEMVSALEAGADLVKLFPASGVGAGYLQDLNGPLPHLPILPTGGITAENAPHFIRAGAVAVGAGGALVDARAVASGEFRSLTERAKEFVRAVRNAREQRGDP